MALALPRFAVFQSTVRQKNYLRYMHEDGEQHGFLQFSGEEIVSPYSKFEIVRANTAGNTGFVHIRCCYNKKYWVANSISSDSFIIAGADEPNEDQSQRSCTLFEPILVDGEGGSSSTTTTTVHVRFRHVKLGHYLRSLLTGDHYHACVSTSYDRPYYIDDDDHTNHGISLMFMSLVSRMRDHYHARPHVRPTAPARLDVFGIIDWESLLILPKHIALKGDNGLYLSARRMDRHRCLQFTSSDIGDPTVGNEVFITKGGSVRIKNNHLGKFWRRRRNWIWADSDDTTTNNVDTLFYPVQVGANVIALRNLGNNNFCDSHKNCLRAAVTTLSREARLVVEELVISRKIYDVNFRLSDASMYNQKIITMVTKTATNNTQVSNITTLKLIRKETRETTWKGSVSLKLGVKTNIQTGIPLVVDGKIELSTEFTGNYEWGETVSTENEVETEYTTTVPPMSKVTVSLLATQGSCGVPFSYTQRDTLMNGKQVSHHFDDGVYTGINSFNFFYETKQEKL
ncbi:hypothetical protein RHSIM_Rhsim05G0010100 [Rhododendron simsii]|uniref:Agglutinin domain-containing protein n=1 Tax=Rhododendron simsii TaxID=118357 RepID=A0A834LQV3_RHOSS|nr:hypothetical protein RHSIM_Rhsim05G0010100 [Rhododendron simsii]